MNGFSAPRLACRLMTDNERVNAATSITLTVTPLDGVTHEALFDPVDLTAGVGANATSGSLKPTAFGDNTLDRIEWESGTLKINLTGSHAGKHIDFLGTDGELVESVAVDDAVSSGGLLTWSVPNQPWRDGDLLMVRLYRKTTELCAEREHFAKPAACYTAPTFTGAPYTFTVAEDARVGSAVGTVAVSHPEMATTTLAIISGDDNGHLLPDRKVDFDGSKAIAGPLAAGQSHVFRVRAVDRNGKGGRLSVPERTVTLPDLPIAKIGHQSDHTVAFNYGAMPPPRQYLPDPAAIIPASVALAMPHWNGKTGFIGVSICQGRRCGGNDDRHLFTVTATATPCRNPSWIACVKWKTDSENHLLGGEMHFEEPAWNEDGLRHYWSSVADDHLSFTDDTLSAIWVYANRFAIHEFGHTFFIPDLPDTTHLGIMNDVHKWDVVEPDDLSYLMQIYLDHTRH